MPLVCVRPSAVQQRAILPILKGRDVIVQSQSGTGKTCVFSLGALQTVDVENSSVSLVYEGRRHRPLENFFEQ